MIEITTIVKDDAQEPCEDCGHDHANGSNTYRILPDNCVQQEVQDSKGRHSEQVMADSEEAAKWAVACSVMASSINIVEGLLGQSAPKVLMRILEERFETAMEDLPAIILDLRNLR